MSNDVVHIPDGLSVEEEAQFIRDEIIKRGGNPDTAYPADYLDAEGNSLTTQSQESLKLTLSYVYDETSPFYDAAWEKNKHLWYREANKIRVKPASMAYQQGFHSSGG